MNDVKIENLLDLNETIAKPFLLKYIYPWEVLNDIKMIILELGKTLDKKEYIEKKDDNGNLIWIHNSAIIGNFVTIEGPTIICKNAVLRHCAYIRGNVIIGESCVVGNSSEVKNAILFNESKAPHFNYIGDSILGYKAHIGAGVKLSNFKSDGSFIKIKNNDGVIDTGLKKFGAIIGNNVEIGCNSVTNPGTIIGRNSTIYPGLSIRGVIAGDLILKGTNLPILVEKTKR